MRMAVAVATICLFTLSLSAITNAQAFARRTTSIPAQALGPALEALAKERHFALIYSADAVAGLNSSGAAGELTTEEALVRLLSGTGLTHRYLDDKTVTLVPAASSPATSSGNTSASRNVEEVVVTGSRLKRVETDGALPVNTYSRQEIDRSGQSSVAEFLGTLNEISLASRNGSDGAQVGTVQLRGLPVGTTLVLLNGRKLHASGTSPNSGFFNLDQIPLAAVERIDVLPVGSSAVYGGDALAGVVNIILKDSMEGWAFDARYGTAEGTSDRGVSVATGLSRERGSFIAIGSAHKRTPLNRREREFFHDADYRRFGGIDARSQFCGPGTVSSTTGGNLPGLASSLAGIPSVGDRPLTVADFTATAGIPNLCAGNTEGNGFGLIYGSEAASLHAAVDFKLLPTVSVFSELTYTGLEIFVRDVPLTLFNTTVPASNPFNPFGEAVRINGRLAPENGLGGLDRDSEYQRAIVGVRAELGDGWEAQATAGTNREKGRNIVPNLRTDAVALSAALADSSPATALNPFSTGRAASEGVLRGIWSDSRTEFAGARDSVDVFVRGAVFQLPAGAIDVIVGAEWGEDRWENRTVGGVAVDLSRRDNAQFGELSIPLLSGRSSDGAKFTRTSLTAAVRRDAYEEGLSEETSQFGLEVRPVRTVLLRATTATAFKPPTLLQQSPVPQIFPTDAFGLRDPRNGNSLIVGGQVLFGPNPELQPQTGKANMLGAVVEPDAVPGLRVSASTWRIELRDQVLLPASAQIFLDHEALFPGFVTRTGSGDTGPVTSVQWTYINFGEINVAGSDAEIAYAFPVARGRLSLSASATHTSKYDVLVTPGASVGTRRGKLNADFWSPEWKGRLFAGFERDPWSAGITGRYIGRYQDSGSSTRELGGKWAIDLTATADVSRALRLDDRVEKASLSLGIVNATNELPEYADAGGRFFDSTLADWRGRYATAQLSVSF